MGLIQTTLQTMSEAIEVHSCVIHVGLPQGGVSPHLPTHALALCNFYPSTHSPSPFPDVFGSASFHAMGIFELPV